MSSTLDLPPKLIDYLNESRAPLPPVTDPDQPLQIDSLGLIRLVAFLESDLNVRVEDDELLAENFATARNIAMLINAKNGAPLGRWRAECLLVRAIGIGVWEGALLNYGK